MNIVSISTLKQQTTRLINRLASQKEPIVIAQRSKPKAVLVDHKYFTALEEAVVDLTDAREAEKARGEPRVLLSDYIRKRWSKKRA
ncbi:hypothetical protein A3A66_02815 [Microgenomates group bacterium RIFCSPLOWO2_01_FULL_46_13]|nr:MAG: hypothetical protein A2783_00090 [Microgenomates group bacterium RIFCSPHIGHO2_01_FULL_45_11]OGV94899.1 MAG: hypothetical protein A3A66_02815 [Microgenomates group bacterium RIFCSPLOWO2_01_FULL_46_13]